MRFIEGFWQDISFGFRMLRKAPGFTLIAAFTLLLGIGSSMTMFSMVQGPILDRPPVRDLQQIANLWVVDRPSGTDRGLLSIPNFVDIRSRVTAFEDLAALVGSGQVLTGLGEPRRVETLMVSANFFRMLGVAPKFGRDFSEEENRPGANRVAMISERLWRGALAAKPDVLGQTIVLDGTPFTIVGVVSGTFWYPSQETEVWVPLVIDPSANRATGSLAVVGRLRRGVTTEQANAEAQVLARSLETQFPSANRNMSMRVVRYESELEKKASLGIVFGLGPSVLALLIGCGNITNLLLARGFARQSELATRIALGARQTRIVQQLLTEYLLLTVIGGVAGVLTAYAGIASLRHMFQSVQPRLATNIRLDSHVLVFGLVATLAIPLLFGLIPAIRASKSNLNDALRHSGSAPSAQVSLNRLPLVVLEIAMAMLLLVVSVLVVRTFVGLERNARPKLEAAQIVTFTISTSKNRPDSSGLLANLAAEPDVKAVGAIAELPFIATQRDEHILEMDLQADHRQVQAVQLDVSAGFFDVLQLTALRGRLPFGGGESVAIVSDAFAEQYARDAVGLNLRRGSQLIPIVGVVRDWLMDAKSGQPLPTVYFPISKGLPSFQVAVRSDAGPSIIPGVKSAVRAWNPDEPMENCQTISQAINEELAGSEMIVRLFGAFTLLALVLASMGVYGVMNYSTIRRTQEMGIRMALGATRQQVLAMVLKEATVLLATGIGLGWLSGVGTAQIIRHELLVAPGDPTTAVLCASVILATGLMASYLPARRAASGDPMIALRSE